ncbi:MAG: hypothetical protein HY656_01145 [Acidobacteria bacterium]|nr:hypothetical protein [Acidobacteriota bacterium]
MPAARLLALLACLLLAPALAAQENGEEPEEPDFFFLVGGPYTQKKSSPQVIWANQWLFDRSRPVRTRDYVGAGRFEWGLTDRLEFDLEFGALASRERALGFTTFSERGADDLLVGVRYRLLREPRFPFTLTTGPQLIAPVASRRRGLGTGEVGYAWDVAAARDWGGPVFFAAAVNLSWRPDVPAFPNGSGTGFDLSALEWGVALGLRPLERPTAGGANHDLHLLLELGGAREDDLEAGRRVRSTPVQFAPGLRYGFLSSSGSLTEIGVSFPVGLTGSAPDWGVIWQMQFELPPLFGRTAPRP